MNPDRGSIIHERLIGREKERDGIAVALDAVAEGSKRGVVLLGEPGIGKSALLRWTGRTADDEGFLTAVARVPEVGAPHSPIPQLLAGTRAACRVRNMPAPPALMRAMELMRDGPARPGHPDALLPLIAEVLESLAGRAPVALIVDDHHRAPAAGRDLLMAILRVLDGRFFFAAAARADQDAALHPFVPGADPWIDALPVGGMDLEDIEEFAAAVMGGPVLPSLGATLERSTLGNPLFIEELLRAWNEAAEIAVVGGYWGVVNGAANDPPPRSLSEMIGARLDRLGPKAIEVARVLAIVGRDARFDELRAITDLERATLVDLLVSLRASGVCREEVGPPVRYGLAHPFYGSTLSTRMSVTERAAMHQSILEAFRGRTGVRAVGASELALHSLRALEPPEDLEEVIVAAAKEAERAGSLREAAKWWEELTDAAERDAGLRARAVEGQASATAWFDAAGAVGLYVTALDLATTDEDRMRLLRGRATAYRRAGRTREAASDLAAALALAGADERFQVRVEIAVNQAVMGQLDAAEEALMALLEEAGDPGERARLSGHLAGFLYTRGAHDEALAMAEGAIAEAGNGWSQLRCNEMWLRFALGDWDGAIARAAALTEEGDRSGDLWNLAGPLAVQARINSWRGEHGLGLDQANRAVKIARRLGNPADTVDALEALIVALLEVGHPDEASAAAERLAGSFDGTSEYRPDYPISFATAAEAFLEAGDLVSARGMVTRARSFDSEVGWAISLSRIESQILLQTGDAAAALEVVRPWMSGSSPLAFEDARLHEQAAMVLSALGEKALAAAQADLALEGYRALGADARAGRTEAWLAKRRPRRPGRPRSDLPGGLTPREVEVLDLVLNGLTNPQIAEVLVISEGTARKHVENLLKKAGVPRRTKLIDFARKHDLRPTETARRKARRSRERFINERRW